jgi:4-amino-4-deoxy-L-arabinose transferase-like glycosyltransferase
MKLYKEGVYETAEGRPVTKVPPMHIHLLALGYGLFGPGVDTAQAVSMVFGCLCVLLLFEWGYRFWGWRVGLMAALLLVTAAKGEFWRYSNRVLNEVHLTFFMLLALYFLCHHLRRPRWGFAAAASACLGLGLLTKEFAFLLAPVFGGVFLLRGGRWWKRILTVGLGLLVLGMVLLPWGLHVKRISGSPLGGVADRGKGHAAEILMDGRAWGIRPAGTLWDLVTFFDKPSWVAQVAILASLGFGIWKAAVGGAGPWRLVVGCILTWYSVFAVFVALPLDLRRLIPLLPLVSLLMAGTFWEVLERARGWGRLATWKPLWVSRASVALFCLFLLINLKPQRVMAGFEPTRLFSSSAAPFLMKEVLEATACAGRSPLVLTNYESLLYFYSRGEQPVRGLRTTRGSQLPPWLAHLREEEEDEEEAGSTMYDFRFRSKRVVMDEEFMESQIRESGASFLIFFRTGHPKMAPEALDRYLASQPQLLAPLCQNRRYAVYRILPGD